MNNHGFVDMWYPSYRDTGRKWKESIASKIRYVLCCAKKYSEVKTEARWYIMQEAQDRLNGALDILADMNIITHEEFLRISRVVWKTAMKIAYKR